MKTLYQLMYETVSISHKYIYDNVQAIRQRIAENPAEQDLADLAYAMREASKLLDDSRKEVNRLHDLAVQLACVLYIEKRNNGQNPDVEPIRTEHCIATPQCKLSVNLPSKSKQPEQYAALMRALGFDPDNPLHDTIRPHWPSICDYVSKLAHDGLPLPEGVDIDATRPVYSLTIRGQKGVLE